MKLTAVLLASCALLSCKNPAAPSRILVQCCAGVHDCYVPEKGAQTCKAGYQAIWGGP